MKIPIFGAFRPALCGALATAAVTFFIVTALILQFVRPDYDWLRTPLSFYLLGPESGWLVTAYFALAMALALIGYGYHRELIAHPLQRSALGLFLFGAVCVCLVALAHTDLPGVRHFTPVGLLHNAAAISAFLAVTLAMLLQSWCLRYDARWRSRHTRALLLAVAAFAALWVYALWTALPRGAAQKTVILLILWWLLLAGRWLSLTRLRARPA